MAFPDIPGYELLDELGRGGMGVVYRARHIALGRIVALKVLDPKYAGDEEFVRNFAQEARTIARLSHPNIVSVHDFDFAPSPYPLPRSGGEAIDNDPVSSGGGEGRVRGLYYLSMPFVAGSTLRELLDSRRVTPQECAAILRQVAEALEYAHSEEVIHRDIKPSNIMLCLDGKAMVMDFGLASAMYGREPGGKWHSAGTPAYMSPEQCQRGSASPRSDQYALGIVAYEMVAGRLPFTAPDIRVLARQHLTEPPPPLRLGRTDVTTRIESAIFRALAKTPEMRFFSVEAFAQELEEACREAADVSMLVGAAPAGGIRGGPVSLVGGSDMAVRSAAHTHAYVWSTHNGQGGRGKRAAWVWVLLLIVLAGGAAAYLTYFHTPAAAAAKTKAPVRKTAKTHRSTGAKHSGSRSTSRHDSGPIAPVSVPQDSPKHDPEATSEPPADQPATDQPAPEEKSDSTDQPSSEKTSE